MLLLFRFGEGIGSPRAEIDKFYAKPSIIHPQEDVGRFDVSVEDVVFDHKLRSFDHLQENEQIIVNIIVPDLFGLWIHDIRVEVSPLEETVDGYAGWIHNFLLVVSIFTTITLACLFIIRPVEEVLDDEPIGLVAVPLQEEEFIPMPLSLLLQNAALLDDRISFDVSRGLFVEGFLPLLTCSGEGEG